MADGTPSAAAGGGASVSRGAMGAIANELERLASELRGATEGSSSPIRETATAIPRELEDVVAEATRRLHAEADRVVAAATRVLESAPSAAIAKAERDARERILAATESACERIEAVDHAQERVARALSRLGPTSAAGAAKDRPRS